MGPSPKPAGLLEDTLIRAEHTIAIGGSLDIVRLTFALVLQRASNLNKQRNQDYVVVSKRTQKNHSRNKPTFTDLLICSAGLESVVGLHRVLEKYGSLSL